MATCLACGAYLFLASHIALQFFFCNLKWKLHCFFTHKQEAHDAASSYCVAETRPPCRYSSSHAHCMQAGKLNLPNPPPQNPSLTESAAAEAERKQREAQLNAELQAKLAAKMTGGDGFVSRGKDNSRMGRVGGQTGSVAKPEQEDDSVRCRTSKICEGVLECGAGARLPLLTGFEAWV